jgi:hypothetical protein
MTRFVGLVPRLGAGDQIGFVLQNGIEKPFGFTFIPTG